MKKNVLNFCGVKPVKITTLEPIKSSTESKRNKWLNKIELLGYQQN
jgi:NAD(P)H dehydrogenase (quinone)